MHRKHRSWFIRQTDMDPVYIHVISLLLSWVFLSAASHKLRQPDRFRTFLDSYRLLSFSARTFHALAVGLAEAAIGVGMLVINVRETAAVADIFVLIAYALAIAVKLLRGRREIDCGCSGPRGYQPISWHLVVRNFLLATMAAATLLTAPARVLGWIDWMTFAFAGLPAVVVYRGSGVLLENQLKLNEMRRGV